MTRELTLSEFIYEYVGTMPEVLIAMEKPYIWWLNQRVVLWEFYHEKWVPFTDGIWRHPSGAKLSPSDVGEWIVASMEAGEVLLPPPF